MTKLSIIVVNWNTVDLLKQCLESVIHNTHLAGGQAKYDIQIEIIVVDNGSSDGSQEMVKKYLILNTKYKILLIENKENQGFAKGNNVGIKQAKGEYIMLLNSDTVVKPGAMEKLVDFLDQNPNTAVSPLLFLPDGKPQNDYYMRFPNLWQVFFYHNPILRPLIMKIPFLSSLVARQPGQNSFEVDQLPGTALIAPKSVWDKVGPLDEDYNFLFEDVDWSWRTKDKGIKLMVVPRAKITHIGGVSWKEKRRKNKFGFYYQFFASLLLFVRKNYAKKYFGLFKWAIIVNFLLTLKPRLACLFLINNGEQKKFL